MKYPLLVALAILITAPAHAQDVAFKVFPTDITL